MMQTLFEAATQQAQSRPQAAALAHDAGPVSFHVLHALAVDAARGLRAYGVAAGDVIAVQLPNSLPLVLILLAASALGATVQMLHMPYRRAELSALLRHGGAGTYVGLSCFKQESPLATVASLGLVPRLIAADDEHGGRHDDGCAQAVVGWSRLLQAGALARPSPTQAGKATADLAPVDSASRYVLLHTSGTTADPKGVPVSHRQFIGNAAAAIGPLQVTAHDVLLPAAPFTHLYGLFVLEMGLLAGACVSLLPAFTPAALLAHVQRDRVTAVFGGPAHLRPLLQEPNATALARLRLVCLSGTAVAPELAQAIEAHMPRGKVIQLWGMSELQAGSYGRPDDPVDVRHRTAGRPGPGTELRIRPLDSRQDGQGRHEVPAGTEGRLQVRGPSLFVGYLDNAAATAAAFDGGWFDTGDIGYLRADGALVLTGRSKEIINRGGVKFNPLDVEAVIDRMPGVVRSALVPMPDPILGERACAFVQLAAVDRVGPGERVGAVAQVGRVGEAGGARSDAASSVGHLSLEQLTQELERAGIARFKWPERLELVAEMPMTPTQKIMRGRLIARLAATGETK